MCPQGGDIWPEVAGGDRATEILKKVLKKFQVVKTFFEVIPGVVEVRLKR